MRKTPYYTGLAANFYRAIVSQSYLVLHPCSGMEELTEKLAWQSHQRIAERSKSFLHCLLLTENSFLISSDLFFLEWFFVVYLLSRGKGMVLNIMFFSPYTYFIL